MRTLRKNSRNAHRGFTLIEATVTIVILAVIGSLSSVIIVNAVDGYVDAATEAQLHLEATTAIDRIVRELRNIPLDAAAAGVAPDIDNISATSIKIGGGANMKLLGSEIRYAPNNPPYRVMLEDVTAVSFQAYDESNIALAASLAGGACDPIRRIAIELTLQRLGATATVRTKVFIRSTLSGGGI